jgi:hypothetical protein
MTRLSDDCLAPSGAGTAFARFRRDNDGGMAVPIALTIPVLFGFAMLAIDGGREFNLHTSAQQGADALALAGAAELDSRPDALARANRAITSLVQNDSRFGEGDSAIDGSSVGIRFLSSLPAQESAPITTANVTTDPRKAKFVEVTAPPVRFQSLFGGVIGNGDERQVSPSRAVAGFESIACKISPLFICNPFERTGVNLFTAIRDPLNKRRLIAMKEKSTTYFPGNFGYLQPAVGSGASEVRDAMAMAEPKGCYKHSGVELRTGAIASTAEAMNTRFDIFDGYFKSERNNPVYRPALNVRKGWSYSGSNACNATLAYDRNATPAANVSSKVPALGLPRDNCFYTNSCSFGGASMGGRVGDGNWDFETYWSYVHGPSTPKPNGWSNSNLPSRYEVYRYELENGLYKNLTVRGIQGVGAEKERGAPECTTQTLPTPEEDPLDRRLFYGAIMDCQALEEEYAISGGSAPPMPVTAFGVFFMTEPMDKNDGTLWVELVDVVEPGTTTARGIVHDIVRLHR